MQNVDLVFGVQNDNKFGPDMKSYHSCLLPVFLDFRYVAPFLTSASKADDIKNRGQDSYLLTFV